MRTIIPDLLGSIVHICLRLPSRYMAGIYSRRDAHTVQLRNSPFGAFPYLVCMRRYKDTALLRQLFQMSMMLKCSLDEREAYKILQTSYTNLGAGSFAHAVAGHTHARKEIIVDPKELML